MSGSVTAAQQALILFEEVQILSGQPPMKDSKRAERRAQRERIKQKRAKYYGGVHTTPRQLGRLVNTSTPCSCYMCGNPRKYFGELTIQERRWIVDY